MNKTRQTSRRTSSPSIDPCWLLTVSSVRPSAFIDPSFGIDRVGRGSIMEPSREEEEKENGGRYRPIVFTLREKKKKREMAS